MIVITHVRLGSSGARTYENIERVKYYVTHLDPATLPANAAVQVESGEGDVAEMVDEIKQGTSVYSDGKPKAEVEIFVLGNREYIRTKADKTVKNNLLSLPPF